MNQHELKNQINFLGRIDKEDGNGFELDGQKLYISVKIIHISTAKDFLEFSQRSQAETQIMNQRT